MKILFTGASSFTGYWFVKALAEAGHEVTVIFTKDCPESYEGIRRARVEEASKICVPVFNCSFGSDEFVDLVKENNFELLCHHAADVTNYRSLDFDIIAAVKNNTKKISEIFTSINHEYFKGIIVTGSVFEQNEGQGDDLHKAFSPYGLSKGISFDIINYFAQKNNLRTGKFVIPNPFGPYEEQRFTYYLMKNWVEGKTPAVNTPDYFRDNIHVSLLAGAYNKFINMFSNSNDELMRMNPSGYTETQGEFTKRFSDEMKERLGLKCEFILNKQTDFSEPLKRINTLPANEIVAGWDEAQAWDACADYYKKIFGI